MYSCTVFAVATGIPTKGPKPATQVLLHCGALLLQLVVVEAVEIEVVAVEKNTGIEIE